MSCLDELRLIQSYGIFHWPSFEGKKYVENCSEQFEMINCFPEFNVRKLLGTNCKMAHSHFKEIIAC